jgi:hypothetical protein
VPAERSGLSVASAAEEGKGTDVAVEKGFRRLCRYAFMNRASECGTSMKNTWIFCRTPPIAPIASPKILRRDKPPLAGTGWLLVRKVARGAARRNHGLVLRHGAGVGDVQPDPIPSGWKYAGPSAQRHQYGTFPDAHCPWRSGRTAHPGLRRRSVSVRKVPSFQPARFGELIEGDDGHQNQADDDLLDIRVYVHQHEAVNEHPDQHRADHRAEDRADAAK